MSYNFDLINKPIYVVKEDVLQPFEGKLSSKLFVSKS